MKISVSFVGSGPGDPELLTLKAINRLKNADVILFDDLSSGPILEYVKPEADLITFHFQLKQIQQQQLVCFLISHVLLILYQALKMSFYP